MIKIEIKSIFGKLLFSYEKENATLKDAVLEAKKQNADLRYANLSDADLSGANLSDADLSGAKNKETAFFPIFCKWSFSIIGEKIQIGCKQKTIGEWDLFFASNEVFSTKRNTSEFKQIEAVYNACKSYLLTLQK